MSQYNTHLLIDGYTCLCSALLVKGFQRSLLWWSCQVNGLSSICFSFTLPASPFCVRSGPITFFWALRIIERSESLWLSWHLTQWLNYLVTQTNGLCGLDLTSHSTSGPKAVSPISEKQWMRAGIWGRGRLGNMFPCWRKIDDGVMLKGNRNSTIKVA